MRETDVKAFFGQVIRELREEQKLSQQELADLSGVDRSFISDLERGLYWPNLKVVYQLSEIFKVRAHKMIQMVDNHIDKG